MALDGDEGRGLKKPLALPMKRNLKGLGKERDRATEWWDCLFEASAKKLRAPQPAGKANVVDVKPKSDASASRTSPSLMALAKREHARKLLMSGFVRGKPNVEYEEKVRQLEQVLAEQRKTRVAASAEQAGIGQDETEGKLTDEAVSSTEAVVSDSKRQHKEAKRKAKKEEKKAFRSDGKEKDRKKKKRNIEPDVRGGLSNVSSHSEAKKAISKMSGKVESKEEEPSSKQKNEKRKRKEEKRRLKEDKLAKSMSSTDASPDKKDATKKKRKSATSEADAEKKECKKRRRDGQA